MKEFTLVGIDGNAFNIMGYTAGAMKKAHFKRDEIQKYYQDATSSDYNHLIVISDEMIQKCNQILGLCDEDED